MNQVGMFPVVCICVWLMGYTSGTVIPEQHSLYDALHYFEVLHTHHITHHTPHPAHTLTRDTTHIHFRTLDRDFNLILTPSRDTLHNSIHISIVTERQKEQRQFPYPHFYTGHMLGQPDTHAVVSIHPITKVLTAAVHTLDDIYYIEPSFRHFTLSHDFHMISYKHSHLKFNLTGQPSQHFCGNREHTLPRQQVSPWQQTPTSYLEKQRLRRDLSGDVCTLHLVATPSFHEVYSARDPDMTTLFLVNLMGDIDQRIFQVPNFQTQPRKLGLVVTNITVYTSSSRSHPRYARDEEKNSERLLELFKQADWSRVCLAHLFTAQDFDDGRLGVAYVASRKRGDIGGICSPVRDGPETANVGVSSFRNSDNRLLLLAEARLVTAHEIGHGWGSGHDPTGDPRCSPPVGRNDGKYLMFPSATDGDQKNNDVFSPCSVDMISVVVDQKGSCFQERSQLVGRCGNYQVEEGEECDGGALGMVGTDPCCTRNCQFRAETEEGERVECSDANKACCEGCRISSPDPQRVCRVHRPGNSQCLRDVYCMGNSTCPTSETLTFEQQYVDTYTSCGQEGRCLPPISECTIEGNCTMDTLDSDPDNLTCYNFCQWHGMEECFCTGEDECRFCCQVPGSGNEACVLFMDLRPDGSSCVGGRCDKGECVPSAQDLIQRLFELFDNPNFNTFVQFMRENIVGTIAILMALLWAPAVFLIHIFDVYRWREHKRVAREYEADLQDAELEDEDDIFFYDNAFEEMEQSQPGILRPEAKLGLMRMDSGTFDYFGTDDVVGTPSAPYVPTATAHGPYSKLWENRLSTITEESQHILNPERDNILVHMSGSVEVGRGHFLQRSSIDRETETGADL